MAAKKRRKKSKKRKISFKAFLFSVFTIGALILFLPTTFLLVLGMLPTFVSAAVDREPGKNKTFTIGAMNFAGCFPYLLGVWMQSNSMETVMLYLSDPATIVIIYGSAAVGYLINWLVTIGVSSLLIQRSQLRLKRIEEEKKQLEARWGKEVNGRAELNEQGFPLDNKEKNHHTESPETA